MSLYQGDRSPKAVEVTISTGSTNGALVTSVLLRVLRFDGTTVDWTMVPTSTSATSVTCVRVLAADGSDTEVIGALRGRAWCFGAGDALLFDTDEVLFPDPVKPARIAWPE